LATTNNIVFLFTAIAASGTVGTEPVTMSTSGRKRLIAAEFSKRMAEKKRQDSSAKIKCKGCVSVDEKAERVAAGKRKAAKAKAEVGGDGSAAARDDESVTSAADLHVCFTCKTEKPSSAYSGSQIAKMPKGRCGDCVATKETELAAGVG
jgi:hypothetical protein